MLKTMVKILSKLIIIVCLVFGCLLVTSKLLRPIDKESKDNTHNKVEGFYQLQDNSIDVLFMGTSHTYYGFNPAVLWKNTGLNSYIFAGQCQPMEVTYHYLEEALKTQNPRLVILDIFALSEDSNKCQTLGTYRVNVRDMKFSVNKIQAYQSMKNTNLFEEVFDISIYHDRISDLNGKDINDIFNPAKDLNFGYTLAYPSDIEWNRDIVNTDKKKEIEDSRLEALMKIIKLCEENEIELLLVKTPYYINESDAMMYNTVWQIAKDNKVQFIDYNKIFKDIDFTFDLDGDSWHANAQGATKITNYLSNFIKKNYNIHPAINIYDQDYKNLYAKTAYAVISRINDYFKLGSFVDNYDVTIMIQQNGFDFSAFTKEEKEILMQFGLDLSIDKQLLYKSNKTTNVVHEAEMNLEIANHAYELDIEGNLYIDGKWHFKGDSACTLIFIDNATGYVLDFISLEKYDQIYLNRK